MEFEVGPGGEIIYVLTMEKSVKCVTTHYPGARYFTPSVVQPTVFFQYLHT